MSDSPAMISAPRVCPQCGAEIPSDAPEGGCPCCLLKSGLNLLSDEDQATSDVAAKEQIATCPTCGTALEETPAGGLGCMFCLLQAGIGSEKETVDDSTPGVVESSVRFGVYEIDCHADGSLCELGRGAMGVTYRATDTSLQRKVALKIIKLDIAARSTDARERFIREARAAAALRHENIATVHEFGMSLKTGQYFYVMELIEGETLEDRVRRAGPLDARTTIGIAKQVTSALATAEKHGLVHRDLKPANLMLVSPDGETSNRKKLLVKIIDFGLAKAIHTATDPKSLTLDRFVGTPAFASPEQFEHSALDVRSDIYSLGETLWFALTGKTPFAGRTLSEIHCAQKSNALPAEQLKAAHVPHRLKSLLKSMLAFEPASRPGTQELAARLQRCSPETRSVRRARFTLAAAALLILGMSVLFVFRPLRNPTAVWNAALDKSIAVLPFENRSEEKQNEYFADGVQDEILTYLAKVADLKVISRTSVLQYKSGVTRNLREIAQQLGVANVVEGSVQRSGNRVRVIAQLIDARNDTHLWAQTYDRDLADVFAIQSEIAKAIAEQLRATLTGQEEQLIVAKPTRNAAAYVFYLRANQFSRNPDTLLEDYKSAERLYMQAIEIDLNFALAHARLASVCAEVFRYYEPTDSWRAKAHAEAEAALRLQPDLAEGHFALGQCIYWMDQDYDKALEQFEIASRLSPSNADARRLIAAIERRQGKWQAALEAYDRVAKLDPQNPSTARELMYTNSSMRRWPEAARWAEQMRVLAPTSLVAKIQSGYLHFMWKGDTRLLKSMVQEIPSGVDPDGSVTAARWDVAMLQRDYSAAKEILETSSANETSYSIAGLTPKIFLEGCTYAAQGDNANAQKAFEQARPAFEASVTEAPKSAERHARLGFLYALMGRKSDAIAEGQRAVELKPESKDAVDGSLLSGYLALIYARVGENHLAIPLIQRLLKTSGPVDSANYSITINDLKYRWEWDPVRNDPRFQKFLAQDAH